MNNTRKGRRWVAAGLLLLLTVVTYLPALRNGFIWDDDDHLTANPAMRAPNGLRLIWSSLSVSRYYPLTLTTFWAQHRLWGLRPLPYHAVNILLHAASAVLLWLILRQLDVRGAWVAAAIWTVHPVNVESVAWITELKNTQSGLLFFLSLVFWLRFRMQSKAGWYWLALLCFTGALLSKPSTVVLPAGLLLIAWWRGERWQRRDVLRFIPFVMVAVGMSALTIVEQRSHVLLSGEQGWSLSIAQRLALAGCDVWFYGWKLLWPLNLSFVYPRWEIDKAGPIAFLPLLGIVGIAGALWAHRGRTAARASAFGLGYFVIALLPVLGFVNVFYFRYSFVADHFQYLASFGVIALVVAAGASVLRQRAMRAVVAGIVIGALGILSWQRCAAYHDVETLWRDTIARNPSCWMAENNLGNILFQAGKTSDAIGHLEQALRLKPDFADAHYNLGNCLTVMGKVPEAIVHYEQAIRFQPDFSEARKNLGLALLLQGNSDAAIGLLEQVVRVNSDDFTVHYYLANALVQVGRTGDAIAHYEQATRLKPDFAEAHYELGSVLARSGRTQEAIAEYLQALRIRPDYPEARGALEQARLQANDPGNRNRP
jgi:tetratricopeptide (TPR) repeat protein